jgi:hypothetical protein
MPPRKNKREAARRAKEQQDLIASRIVERHFLADMLFDQYESQLEIIQEQHKEEIMELQRKLAEKEQELQHLQLQLQQKTQKPSGFPPPGFGL